MMKKISSTATGIYKKVFPALWFGCLGMFVMTAVIQGAVVQGNVMFLVGPCVMGIFGYFLMKRLVWDLVDEVYDGGDFLLVKNRGREHRISLADIINVNSTIAVNPMRITLRLGGASASGAFGPEITFSPKKQFTLNPFAKSQVAEDLIVRVDRARSKRTI